MRAKSRSALVSAVLGGIVAVSAPAAAAQAECSLVFVADEPLVMEVMGDRLSADDIELATSCPVSEVEFSVFGDDELTVSEPVRSRGRGLIRVDVEGPVPGEDETVAAELVARVPDGPLARIALNTTTEGEIALEILLDPLILRYRSDDASTDVTVPVKATGDPVAIDTIEGRLYLDRGGSVPVVVVATGGEPVVPSDGIVELELSVENPSTLDDAAAATVVLQRAADDQALATADVTISRRPSSTIGWTLVLGSLAAAGLTVIVGGLAIVLGRFRRPRRRAKRLAAIEEELDDLRESGSPSPESRGRLAALADEKERLTAEQAGDPRGRLLEIRRELRAKEPAREQALLRDRAIARAAAKKADAAVLPSRAKWSFTDGWAGSLTAFGAAAAAILGATGLLNEFLPGLSPAPFVAVNVFFVALVGAAPMAYNAAGRYAHGELVGTFGGLYLASLLSLWGIYGFLAMLLVLNLQVVDNESSVFFTVMLCGAAVGVFVYAVRTMSGRAQPEKATASTPVPTVTVSLKTNLVVRRALEGIRSSPDLDEETEAFLQEVIDGIDQVIDPPELADVEVEVPVDHLTGGFMDAVRSSSVDRAGADRSFSVF